MKIQLTSITTNDKVDMRVEIKTQVVMTHEVSQMDWFNNAKFAILEKKLDKILMIIKSIKWESIQYAQSKLIFIQYFKSLIETFSLNVIKPINARKQKKFQADFHLAAEKNTERLQTPKIILQKYVKNVRGQHTIQTMVISKIHEFPFFTIIII